MPTRLWQWGLSGAVLVLLGLGLSAAQGTPLVALGAPAAAPTTLVDDQSPNRIAAAAMVGVVSTPNPNGTPGVYTVLQSDSTGHLAVAGNTPLPTWTPFPSPVPQFTPLPTWTAVAVQAVQPNGAVAAQTPMAVALAGQQIAVRSTVVLPAQTPVAYTAGDVVTSATPAALTFANACRTTGGSGYVVGADLATDQSTNTANYRLWLYQSPPPTLVADNAANTLLFANNAIRVGYVDIPNLATNTGSNTAAYSQVPDARLSYTCAAGSTTLSGVLEAEAAFTPASGQIVDAGLRVQRD